MDPGTRWSGIVALTCVVLLVVALILIVAFGAPGN